MKKVDSSFEISHFVGHCRLDSILVSYLIPGFNFSPITRPKLPALYLQYNRMQKNWSIDQCQGSRIRIYSGTGIRCSESIRIRPRLRAINSYVCKKRIAIFPSPDGMSLYNFSLAGKIANLFLQCLLVLLYTELSSSFVLTYVARNCTLFSSFSTPKSMSYHYESQYKNNKEDHAFFLSLELSPTPSYLVTTTQFLYLQVFSLSVSQMEALLRTTGRQEWRQIQFQRQKRVIIFTYQWFLAAQRARAPGSFRLLTPKTVLHATPRPSQFSCSIGSEGCLPFVTKRSPVPVTYIITVHRVDKPNLILILIVFKMYSYLSCELFPILSLVSLGMPWLRPETTFLISST